MGGITTSSPFNFTRSPSMMILRVMRSAILSASRACFCAVSRCLSPALDARCAMCSTARA